MPTFFMKIIETKRLKFQNYGEENNADFIKLFTDERVMKQVDEGDSSREYAEKVWSKIREDFYPRGIRSIWAVFSKENSKYIGHAIIIPMPAKNDDWEIGIILKHSEWGKGFGTEIVEKLVEYSFVELNQTKVYATVDDDNFAVINVLKKAGMKFEHYEFDNHGRFSVYSITQNTKG